MAWLLVGGLFASAASYLGYRAACPSWDDPLDYMDDRPDTVLRRELWTEYGKQHRPWWCSPCDLPTPGGYDAIYARHGVQPDEKRD